MRSCEAEQVGVKSKCRSRVRAGVGDLEVMEGKVGCDGVRETIKKALRGKADLWKIAAHIKRNAGELENELHNCVLSILAAAGHSKAIGPAAKDIIGLSTACTALTGRGCFSKSPSGDILSSIWDKVKLAQFLKQEPRKSRVISCHLMLRQTQSYSAE